MTCLVQGQLSLLEQELGIITVVWKNGYPIEPLIKTNSPSRVKGLATVSKIRLMIQSISSIERPDSETKKENLSPQPGHGILTPATPPDPDGQSFQEPVSHLISQRLVDIPEVIQIVEAHGKGLRIGAGSAHYLTTMIDKKFAIRKTGQGIKRGIVGNLLFTGVEFRDITKDRHIIADLLVPIGHAGDGQMLEIGLTIFASVPYLTLPAAGFV